MLSKSTLKAARKDHAKLLAKMQWHKAQADAIDAQLQALDKLLEPLPKPAPEPQTEVAAEKPADPPATLAAEPDPPEFLRRVVLAG